MARRLVRSIFDSIGVPYEGEEEESLQEEAPSSSSNGHGGENGQVGPVGVLASTMIKVSPPTEEAAAAEAANGVLVKPKSKIPEIAPELPVIKLLEDGSDPGAYLSHV